MSDVPLKDPVIFNSNQKLDSLITDIIKEIAKSAMQNPYKQTSELLANIDLLTMQFVVELIKSTINYETEYIRLLSLK